MYYQIIEVKINLRKIIRPGGGCRPTFLLWVLVVLSRASYKSRAIFAYLLMETANKLEIYKFLLNFQS